MGATTAGAEEINKGDTAACRLGPANELGRGVAIEGDVVVAQVTTALVVIAAAIGVAVRGVPGASTVPLLLAFDVNGNSIILRFFCFVEATVEVTPGVFVS